MATFTPASPGYSGSESSRFLCSVDETKHQTRRRSKQSWAVILFATSLGFVVFTWTTFSLIFHHSLHTAQARDGPQKPCGRSPSEAQAAGCQFDPMMDEWLPDSCYDGELAEQFLAMKDWEFYSDINMTRRLTIEELSQSPMAYTTLEYHVTHCAFALRKLHRAIVYGRQIEKDVASEKHTTHCAEFLRTTIGKLERSNDGSGEPFSVMAVATPLHPGFPTCIDPKDIRQS